MEFLASNDFEISNTPRKGNAVTDVLSRKKLTLSTLFVERQSLEFIASFNFRSSTDFVPGLLATLEVRPTVLDSIGAAQREDPQLAEVMDKLIKGETSSHLNRYSIEDKGLLRRDGRLCVPQARELTKKVLEEAHHSKMTIHPGVDKIYKDIK